MCPEEEGVPPYKVCMTLNGEPVTFEVDTGCGLTILNMKTFKEKVKNAPPWKKPCLKSNIYTVDIKNARIQIVLLQRRPHYSCFKSCREDTCPKRTIDYV